MLDGRRLSLKYSGVIFEDAFNKLYPGGTRGKLLNENEAWYFAGRHLHRIALVNGQGLLFIAIPYITVVFLQVIFISV